MDARLEKLRVPIPPERIKWRIGSTTQDKKRGLALAYIDARVVQDRLDEAVGPENWQSYITELSGGVFICRLSIRIGDEWISKSDGAGKTEVEGEKGACSDAIKRAAVNWGVARELYGLDAVWVEIEPAGRSYKIKASELPRLAALIGGNGKKPEAPEDEQAANAEPDDAEKDAINREDFFGQVAHAVNANGLDKDYVWSEMRRRAKGAVPTTEELGHQAKQIGEHPELWRKPNVDKTDAKAEGAEYERS